MESYALCRALPARLRGAAMSLPWSLAVGFVILVATLVLIGIILDGAIGGG